MPRDYWRPALRCGRPVIHPLAAGALADGRAVRALLGLGFFHVAPPSKQACRRRDMKKAGLHFMLPSSSVCGKKGIRTLGTQSVQRFSRPPRSPTPASFLGQSKSDPKSLSSGGDRGIRTPEAFRLNGFQDRRYRPLSHISAAKIQLFGFMQLIRRKKNHYLCISNAFQECPV